MPSLRAHQSQRAQSATSYEINGDKFKAAIGDERATSCKPKTTTAAEKVMSYPMPCYVIPCHAMPRHAMPCHPMQCHAMPCHALPCYVMSCHAMLRHSRFLQPLRLKQCLTEFSDFRRVPIPCTYCGFAIPAWSESRICFGRGLVCPCGAAYCDRWCQRKNVRQHKHSCRYLALVSALAHYLVAVEELARSFLAYL